MKAVFVELPAFARYRAAYFDDSAFLRLQVELMKDPGGGDLIRDSGGLRKLRFPDERRGKGKRSGLRVIYFWWEPGKQFWPFTVYDKDETDDLSAEQRKTLKASIKVELEARSKR